MRITIVDTQTSLVCEVLENVDLQEFSDFLSAYLDLSFIWCVTPAGQAPEYFQHDRHGRYPI